MRSRLKSVVVKESVAFDPHFQVLKEALNDWIDGKEEEVKVTSTKFQPEPGIQDRERLKLHISAGILALLVRLFRIAGLTQSMNQLIDHIISTYTSKKVENITRTSFINLYKKPSIPVTRALRKLLNQMIAEINQYLDTGKLSEQSNPQTE